MNTQEKLVIFKYLLQLQDNYNVFSHSDFLPGIFT